MQKWFTSFHEEMTISAVKVRSRRSSKSQSPSLSLPSRFDANFDADSTISQKGEGGRQCNRASKLTKGCPSCTMCVFQYTHHYTYTSKCPEHQGCFILRGFENLLDVLPSKAAKPGCCPLQPIQSSARTLPLAAYLDS